jgi:DNA-binding NarL/FixJ family response regulator
MAGAPSAPREKVGPFSRSDRWQDNEGHFVIHLGPPAPTDCLGLTAREAQVLLQVDRGLTNLEIAADLGISANTVKRHLEHIFDKLGVRTRIAAVGRLRDGGGPEPRSG